MGQNLVDSIRIPRTEYKELIVLKARVEILVGMLEKGEHLNNSEVINILDREYTNSR